jgi:serine/threonine protein kinase
VIAILIYDLFMSRENLPKKIGSIIIIRKIGSGGMGVVYEGRDSDGNEVAVKVLRDEFLENEDFVNRLSKEAKIIKKLKNSRIAKVLDIKVNENPPHFVMELINGESLESYVEKNGPLPPMMLQSVSEALIEALLALEIEGVVHKDIKPSNVIFGRDGIKIIDFGISSLLDDPGVTQVDKISGTSNWLSPEQIKGHNLTPSSDIFSAGMVLFFAATGKHPFGTGRSDAIMYRIINEEPEVLKNYPQIDLIKKMMTKSSMNRITHKQLSQELEKVNNTVSGTTRVTNDSLNDQNLTRVITSKTSNISESAKAKRINPVNWKQNSNKSNLSETQKFFFSIFGAFLVLAVVLFLFFAYGFDESEIDSNQTAESAEIETTLPTEDNLDINKGKIFFSEVTVNNEETRYLIHDSTGTKFANSASIFESEGWQEVTKGNYLKPISLFDIDLDEVGNYYDQSFVGFQAIEEVYSKLEKDISIYGFEGNYQFFVEDFEDSRSVYIGHYLPLEEGYWELEVFMPDWYIDDGLCRWGYVSLCNIENTISIRTQLITCDAALSRLEDDGLSSFNFIIDENLNFSLYNRSYWGCDT